MKTTMKKTLSACMILVLLLTSIPFGFSEEATWVCPTCGQEGLTSKFCPDCGTARPVDPTWDCPSCGITGLESAFCPDCGTKKPDGTGENTSSNIEPAAIPQSAVVPSTLHVGDEFTFGRYEQDNDLSNGPEPIEWIVLDDNGNGNYLVISKYLLDSKPYETNHQVITTGTHISWAMCSLRAWLNGEFYQSAFTTDEKTFIPLSNVTNKYGGDTQDHLFILNKKEAQQYLGGYNELISFVTPYAKANSGFSLNSDIIDNLCNSHPDWKNVPFVEGSSCWWLRSDNDGYINCASIFSVSGYSNDVHMSRLAQYTKDTCVRPVLMLSLTPILDGTVLNISRMEASNTVNPTPTPTPTSSSNLHVNWNSTGNGGGLHLATVTPAPTLIFGKKGTTAPAATPTPAPAPTAAPTSSIPGQIGFDVGAVMKECGISGSKKVEANGYYVGFASERLNKAQYKMLVQFLLDRGYTQTITEQDYHEISDTMSEKSVFSSDEAEIDVYFAEILPRLLFYCHFHRQPVNYQENIYQPSDFRIEDMAREFGYTNTPYGWKTGESGGRFVIDFDDHDFLEQAIAYLKQYGITLTKAMNEDDYYYETDGISFSIKHAGSEWQINLKSSFYPTTPEPHIESGTGGSKTCPRCGGDRVERCTHCSGGRCSSCGGSRGRMRYFAGRDQWEDCISCGGSGDCRNCGGDGKVTCSVCFGRGTVN